MASFEALPDKPLDDDELRRFNAIVNDYALEIDERPASEITAELGSYTHMFPQEPSRREVRQRKHRRVVWGTVGALGLCAAVTTIGAAAYEPTPLTEAQIRAEAFKHPEVLIATGTCAKELALENQRISYGAAYKSEADIGRYPAFDEYIDAQALAITGKISCTPPANSSGTTSIKVHGMMVTVTGSARTPAPPEAVSLLDLGSNVTDICQGATPDIKGAERALTHNAEQVLTEQAAHFTAFAQDFCPPNGK